MPRSTTKLESVNMPAFQRKRSLAAKARKQTKPRTALERREAGIPVVKPKRTRRTVRTVRSSSVGTRVSSGSSLSDPGYRAKIAARRAALSGSSSTSSSSGGFASLGSAEEKYSSSTSGGFSAPMVDEEVEDVSDFREMRACGTVSDFFDQVDVAVVDVHSRISVGDRLVFETIDGLFEQTLDSMQVDRKDVEVAYSGDDVGIKVKAKPRKGGQVYKVV